MRAVTTLVTMHAPGRTDFRFPLRASGPRAIAPAVGVAIAVAALVGGCTGQTSGPVAPAVASPTSGIPSVDAVQAAIGGNWNRPLSAVDSPCRLGDEPARGDGVQDVASTVAQAARSEEDAKAAAQLASSALADAGAEPSDVIQANGIAAVTGTHDDASSVTVTIDASQSYIEFRSECVAADDTA